MSIKPRTRSTGPILEERYAVNMAHVPISSNDFYVQRSDVFVADPVQDYAFHKVSRGGVHTFMSLLEETRWPIPDIKQKN